MIAQFVFFHFSETDGTLSKKTGERITESGFYHAWCTARKAAGCPASIPHDFRRTAVRNMVRSGIPERVAMRLTGHKTRSVFERYNVVSDGDLRAAAGRLRIGDGHTFGHTSPSATPSAQRHPQNS
jgi:integrase